MVKVNTSQGLIRLEHATDYRIDDQNGVLHVVEKVSETQAQSGYKRGVASFAPSFWLSVEIAKDEDEDEETDDSSVFGAIINDAYLLLSGRVVAGKDKMETAANLLREIAIEYGYWNGPKQ